MDYGNGEYAALCQDPFQRCSAVPLTRRDVLVHELDLAGFSRVLAEPLGVLWRPLTNRGDGIWAMGLSNQWETKAQPVFLAILPETRRFEASLNRLLLSVTGPFVLTAPTSRHLSVESRELLQRRGAAFVSLEDRLFIDDAGRLVSTAVEAVYDKIPATPLADRRRAVAEFRQRHRCRVKDIQEAAGVDQADYYKWLRGAKPDHYSTCADIERVLRVGWIRKDSQHRA